MKKEGDDEPDEDKKNCSSKYKDNVIGLAKRFKQKGDENNKKKEEKDEEEEKNTVQQPKDPKAIAAFYNSCNKINMKKGTVKG